MTKSRGIRAPHKFWTQDEISLLHAIYADTLTAVIAKQIGRSVRTVYTKARGLGLKKSEKFLKEQGGRLDGIRGSGSRFKPGNRPWSAGLEGLHLSPDTEFKPGARPVNWMPLGARRINTCGVLERKIREGNNGALNWEAEHRMVWKEAHGPIPKNHVVAFKAGVVCGAQGGAWPHRSGWRDGWQVVLTQK